jgi:hypothetical protein
VASNVPKASAWHSTAPRRGQVSHPHVVPKVLV